MDHQERMELLVRRDRLAHLVWLASLVFLDPEEHQVQMVVLERPESKENLAFLENVATKGMQE